MAIAMYLGAVIFPVLMFAILKIYPFLRRTWLSKQALKQFPMEDYHWLWGHLKVHTGPTHEGFILNNAWTAKYPRYYCFFMGPLRPILALNHPETVKQVLSTTEPKGLSGGGGYALIYPWIGDGLLLSSGKKWSRNRKMLTPGFHFDVLKPYIGVYNSCVQTLLNAFDEQSAKTGKSMEIFMPVSMCTLDIILRCAFSTERNIQSQAQSDPYVSTVVSLAELIIKRAVRPYLYFDSLFYKTKMGKEFKACCELSHNFATSIISERKKTLAKNTPRNRYVDFLDILLLARDDSGNSLTDSEIRDEVETFMFEGHDTTASAISWILYNLARHAEIQATARAEVDRLLRTRASDCILWDDLTELPYVTRCIKESMRLHPPVPVISRETSQPFAIDGKTIPPGTFIDIAIWNVHHNPTVWEDPLTYNPDRFLHENMKDRDSHAFIPFSAGPRNCIGQTFAMNELKVSVARILRMFEMRVDETIEVRFKPEIVLRAENGIHLSFTKRNLTNLP